MELNWGAFSDRLGFFMIKVVDEKNLPILFFHWDNFVWNLRLLVAIQTDSLSSVRTDFSFLHLLTKPNRSILDLPLWHATNHDLHRNAHFHRVSFVVLFSVPTKSQNDDIKRMTHLMNFTYSSWRTNYKITYIFLWIT